MSVLKIADFRIAAGVSLLLVSCSTAAQPAKQGAAAASTTKASVQSAADVVARVGTTAITLGQVDEQALQQPAARFGGLKLSQALYEARRAVLDDLIGDALLDQEARARGLNRAALIDQEITSKVAAPTDDEIGAWYQANQARVGGATLDRARSAIRAYLLQERTNTARQTYLDRLKTRTAVTVMLDIPRQTVQQADAPAKGPAGAPVELIEFSDFQCPYCLRAYPTVQQVLAAYGDRVRFVYRHYPLPNHPHARPAAEAAQCANEQGQFWPYYDRLFTNQAKLADGDLKQDAADLGLDTTRFNQCVDSHKYKDLVDADLKAGEEAGVSGTPAFFINGRPLSGAQPFDAFKRVIDEELELKKRH